ncbi:hypothetical protein TNCV_4344501 [Trichonephila clavipes]|nr:hypothetical protein TNCV_4344501 [Trichonephila clavipes]
MISYRYTTEITNANLRLSQPSRRPTGNELTGTKFPRVKPAFNATLQSSTRAIGDGPHTYELWSNDEDKLLSKLPRHINGRSLSQIYHPTRWVLSDTRARTHDALATS